MTLPDGFIFSQSNLQDYIDCPYRFYLRYIRHTKWPALVAGDALEFEKRGQTGARFHRLIQQYLLGIPETRLTKLAAADPEPSLARWWDDFLMVVPPLLEGTRYVEMTLGTSISSQCLIAKYDLILVRPDGTLSIYDWKTSARKIRKSWLLDRVQTRLYRLLLAHSGAALTSGESIAPEQIEMNYWFAPHPEAMVNLPYNQESFDADQAYFSKLIEEIQTRSTDSFTRTSDLSKCRFCVFRSHCDRGAAAGDLAELDDFSLEAEAAEQELDFDQIAEIEF
ncbi:PD-(D/E)XK nuclease family protein [bacterium]|nr:PD-(D/E)XK nuclease family protein [bacterium]